MSLLSVLNFLLSKDLEGSYSQTFSCYGTLCPFLWHLEKWSEYDHCVIFEARIDTVVP